MLISSCGTLIKNPVQINNEPLYYLKEASDAKWVTQMYFLTTDEDQLTHSEWDAVSAGMVCMPLKSFGDFNTEIGKLCSQVPCDYQAAIQAFIQHLESVTGTRLN